jgi:8-oxo-dGTP diphosphatase
MGIGLVISLEIRYLACVIEGKSMNVCDIDWNTWEPSDIATLVFVFQSDQVLLIRKKRGLGAGKINAPGGKVDPGETLEEAALRELEEEVCVRCASISYVGEHRFQFVDGYAMHVHVFRSEEYQGVPQETEEAIPMWFSVDEIPYDEMWEDDKIWIPMMLEGISFSGRYIFDGSSMLDYEIDTTRED